jgi:hypothetical protein
MSRYDKTSHTFYIALFLRRTWQVQFVEEDLMTPLPRTFTFADPEKMSWLDAAKPGQRPRLA